jgi:phage protein D
MLAPKYSIKIGSDTFDSTSSDNIRFLRVNLSLDVPVDFANLVLRMNDQGYDFKQGDKINISIGYDDNDAVKVFSGTIDSIKSDTSKVKVSAVGPMWNLVTLYLNKIYESQNCGQIVSDLISSAKVDSSTISSGVDLPTYVVDGNSSAYDHIRGLADRSGFDVFISPDGKLTFQKFTKDNAPVAAEYGVNVIGIENAADQNTVRSLTVFGESPSSTKGSNTVHWLTKDAVDGSAGSGRALLISDPAVRDKSTASNVASAKLAMRQRGHNVFVEIIGDPNAALAATLRMKGFPDSTVNGDYEIRSVEHILSKVEGFKSIVGCCGVSD